MPRAPRDLSTEGEACWPPICVLWCLCKGTAPELQVSLHVWKPTGKRRPVYLKQVACNHLVHVQCGSCCQHAQVTVQQCARAVPVGCAKSR